MTDVPSRERSLTSDCGSVTVTVAPGAAPRIELTAAAERMFTRDLAELVTDTARKAAEALDDEPEGPRVEEAAEMLAAFAGDLRERGVGALLERRKAFEDDDPEERPRPADPGRAKLALDPAAVAMLDDVLELWKRSERLAPGTKDGDEHAPVGRARSESKLVTVESTLAYPVSQVILSKRALEIGAKGLSLELTETAAAAVADRDAKQGPYFDALGLPYAPGEAKEVLDRGNALNAEGLAIVQRISESQDRITRMFKDGGHFA
ncbi:hypothetical protein [Glycomyces terrestris]|uniref:Uncharacterized protein n=1 Tax=Glycomyces terrestris TaxID=2493553 RepID=A0A426UVQ8_9ACTN|nr:hypothetical protein [Glycomyces terrestris]RRR98261.1 hypothetical protein EIW28_15215 [Glycomyces terrestris]